jgi:hypothetical protein
METESQSLLCRLSIAGKAVKNTGDCITSLSKNSPGVSLGFPAMNDQRQPKFSGQRDLSSKYFLLHLNRREIIMVIQPDFTNPHNIVLLCDHIS